VVNTGGSINLKDWLHRLWNLAGKLLSVP